MKPVTSRGRPKASGKHGDLEHLTDSQAQGKTSGFLSPKGAGKLP
jgi:hypothetical protein